MILSALLCPKCGKQHILHTEQLTAYRPVLGIDNAFQVVVDNTDWPPVLDQEGINEQFFCQTCFHSWPVAGAEIYWCDNLNEIEEYP